MSKKCLAKTIPLLLLASAALLFTGRGHAAQKKPQADPRDVVLLPQPDTQGRMTVEQALFNRRSRRNFADQPLTLPQLSQLLWAAQGRTHPLGYRTAPSAGALYPIQLYVVVANVLDLEPGVYRYELGQHTLKLGAGLKASPHGPRPKFYYAYDMAPHQLIRIRSGQFADDLQQACLDQELIGQAPASIVIAGDYSVTAKKYGQRAERYVHIEVGHIGQNIYLQAESLGLGTCAVGAFEDKQVKALLGIREEPLYVMPVGTPQSESGE